MAESMTTLDNLFSLLAAPMEPHLVLQRVGAGGQMLDYITARTVMDRLDQVLGPENWWDRYQMIPGGVLCSLTIRLPSGELITKEDAGGPQGMKDPGDDTKSAFSDALKRAAVKFGVARYLETSDHVAKPQRHETAPAPYKSSLYPVRDSITGKKESPAPARDHSRHFPPPPDVPKTGREFYGWLREVEKESGREVLKPINARAKSMGFPSRTIDLSENEVAQLLPIAREIAAAPMLPISGE